MGVLVGHRMSGAVTHKTQSRLVSAGLRECVVAADYFRTMVEVVDHLHQLGVMHRDIKVKPPPPPLSLTGDFLLLWQGWARQEVLQCTRRESS